MTRWTRTRSWSAPGWPGWSPPPNWREPGARCCCSTRSPRPTSAARRSGRSAGCSWSTRPSSAGWASRTPTSWPGRTGWAARASTAASTTRRARTTGRTGGRRPMWTSPPARNGPGCTRMGVRWFPVVGWAERGGYLADGHGNSVPRFHVTWGTGPAVVEPFEKQVRDAVAAGQVASVPASGRRAPVTGGAVDGVRGAVLEPSSAARGTRSSRTEVGEFELRAPAVIVTSGGIGANQDLIRAELAGPARPGAEAHGHRRARARRRPDAGHHRAGRRPGRQPRPDVALHRGPPELGPDLAQPRHPDPARAVLDVVRRHRQAVPRARLPRLRHPGHAQGHHCDRVRLLLVRRSPRRSSRRSSPSPARSRTPT